MNIRYRFLIGIGSYDSPQEVHPVYKDDLSLEYARESGQMFMRATLSSGLDFIGEDYTLIMAQAFDTEFIVGIESSADGGRTWGDYYKCHFFMTDCTVNVDDKKVSVKPEPYDRYNKILAGLDKEYDLIKLTPALQPVTVVRRPVLQVYALGDQILTNILSDMYWEQECNEVDSQGDMQDYHFGKIGGREEITFDTTLTGLTATFTGSWAYGNTQTGEWDCFSNGQGVYSLRYFQEIEVVSETNVRYKNGLRLYRISDSLLCWEFIQSRDVNPPSSVTFREIPQTFEMDAKVTGLNDIGGSWVGVELWGRLVLASSTYNGNSAYEIPSDDIVSTNRNFRYCVPFPVSSVITMSNGYQTDPTEWGMRSDGTYFTKPAPTVTIMDYIPIAQSLWLNASIWFNISALTKQAERDGRKDTQIGDAFPLDSCIRALLGEIDSDITFEATDDYSVFLYGTNPIISSGWGRLFVTPKSNVLVAEYTQPARKAPCTLKDFLDMLRKTCALYWFIDDDGRLRIEHVSWFKNGGSYEDVRTVGIDLTTMRNSRNGRTWAYGTSEYKYEKLEMAERYQMGWMDDSTKPFSGEAIEVLSKYVQQGKIEEDTVGMFNADVDYMMLNPSNVSQDGFALLMCTYFAGAWRTTITAQYLDMNEMQNWQLAFSILQPSLLIYDMPAWDIRVNGGVMQAKGIQRKKTQQVSIPAGADDPDVTKLVHTGIGDGEVTRMSVRLTSRMVKMTLVYDTEDEPEQQS